MSREQLTNDIWKACDILRRDDNCGGVMEYVEHIAWLLFLKFFDEQEEIFGLEAELAGRSYKRVVDEAYRWSKWVPKALGSKVGNNSRRTTPEWDGDGLMEFVRGKLIPYLASLNGSSEREVISGIFSDRNVVLCASPYNLKDVLEIIDSIDFKNPDDIHTVSHIYEGLQKLAPNGRAAVLAPSGLLFSNSTAEALLRHQLVDENSLEAVISFPKDAFQPYSPLQTHLLLFSKSHPSQEHLTWFCQVEYDGYPSGRGRDLTQQPSRYSDLPFLEKFIVNFEADSVLEFTNQENALIAVRKITDGANLLGIVCRGITSQLTSILIDFYPPFEKQPPFILLETATTEESLCVQILLDVNAEPSVVENRLEFIEKRKQNKKDPDPGKELLSQPVKARGIAIALFNQVATIPEARLLGMAVESNAIKEQSYDLRPERYIGKQEELRLADSPTQILTRIYGNQRQLQERIDSLFGRLEMSPIAGLQIPSPLLELEPFGIFSEEQTIIWEKIRKKTEPITPEKPDNGLTAVHFTPEDIETSDTGEVSDTTRQTLDLLECMGIIVAVTVADTKTGESIALYRRVTERDKWDLDSQGSVLTGGSQ